MMRKGLTALSLLVICLPGTVGCRQVVSPDAYGPVIVPPPGMHQGSDWIGPPVVGGMATPAVVGAMQNPAIFAGDHPEALWNALVDVVDDYFRIRREERVRQVGDVLVEGRIETDPLTGATLLEPWRKDSIGMADRLESTFQSIRRIGHFRVIPTAGGYLVEARVEKELENVERPEYSTSAAAVLPLDRTLDRAGESLSKPPLGLGWIPQGRDVVLEQEILQRLLARMQGAGQ